MKEKIESKEEMIGKENIQKKELEEALKQNDLLKKQLEMTEIKTLMENKAEFNYLLLKSLNQIGEELKNLNKGLNSIVQQLYDRNEIENNKVYEDEEIKNED